MRIALTTGSLSRNAGGLFESVRALGKGLNELAVEVSIYGLRDKNWERDEEVWKPLSARAFPFIGPRAFAWSPDMDTALDQAHPDVVALQGLWQYSSIATRRQWRLNGIPYVISPRGMLDKWALANSRWKKVLASFAFESAVMCNAACIHALCKAEADSIRAYGLKQRIEIVPNGVHLPEGLTTEDTEHTEKKKRLLFLGRIHPKKGLVGALRAWADIQNSKPKIQNSKQWQFVIAGWDQGGHEEELCALCDELGLGAGFSPTYDGIWRTPQKSKFQKLKAISPEVADVVFWGPAFGKEKETLLRTSEAFILPSLSEGLPMSVLEAWAFGLPVVMTPECNLPEGFVGGASLEIQNVPGKFQTGLRALLEMSDIERRGMGRRGRKLVEEKFTWPKVAAQMKALYEDLLGT